MRVGSTHFPPYAYETSNTLSENNVAAAVTRTQVEKLLKKKNYPKTNFYFKTSSVKKLIKTVETAARVRPVLITYY